MKEPKLKTKALIRYFGWQGGTIHQIAKETGVDAGTMRHGVSSSTVMGSDNCAGWFAARTCDLDARLRLAKRYYQNADFWIGVASTWKVQE